ncbi:MAG: hypothetical protein CMA66_00415 [Euryarchaeota archaeon]|jgi:hypothetical protein|nr:hypothetical protein [Euryarchaeota archaeon]
MVYVTEEKLRVVYVGKDIELRIISLLVRGQEISQEVVFVDLGSNDSTTELAEDFGCQVLNYGEQLNACDLAKFMAKSSLESGYCNLIILITPDWKLRELPVIVNRSREGWDIYFSFVKNEKAEKINEADLVLAALEINHLFLSSQGLIGLANSTELSTAMNFSSDYKVRVIESSGLVNLPQRESLATASRFAQLFYWMLETKHPLFLFGIPGIVLFILGYKLSGNVVDTFSELNSISIGVTLTTIAMTLIGLFAMMVAIILYIMGKQVEQIQSQYKWNNTDDKTT